jgi:hypothetical protein
MSKQNEDYAKSWELLTDAERAELLKPEAWMYGEDEVTSSHYVGSMTCFALNIASSFVGFLLGWWLS